MPDPILIKGTDVFSLLSICVSWIYMMAKVAVGFTHLTPFDTCVSNRKSRSPVEHYSGVSSPTDRRWHCDSNILQLAGLGNAPLECCEIDACRNK